MTCYTLRDECVVCVSHMDTAKTYYCHIHSHCPYAHMISSCCLCVCASDTDIAVRTRTLQSIRRALIHHHDTCKRYLDVQHIHRVLIQTFLVPTTTDTAASTTAATTGHVKASHDIIRIVLDIIVTIEIDYTTYITTTSMVTCDIWQQLYAYTIVSDTGVVAAAIHLMGAYIHLVSFCMFSGICWFENVLKPHTYVSILL